MAAERNKNTFHGVSHVLAMILAQLLLSGNIIISKLADNDGMTMRVMVAYRWIFATAFLGPIALIVERNKRPKLTRVVIFQSFLSGLLGGALFSNLFFTSVTLISPTFVTAIYNLVPAMTFVIAIILRLETLSFYTLSGKAKVVGTLVCVGGAMFLTFYRGSEIHIWSTKIDLLHHNQHMKSISHLVTTSMRQSQYGLGIILALLSCISYALWIILLAKISKNYPCHYSSAALMSLMGAIQSVLFALCIDRKGVQWKLGWNIRLLTAFYLGVLGSGFVVIMMTWCSKERGPLFVSVFNPLTLLFVALGSSLLLDETLYLGSVLGGIMIILGVYIVLWGKASNLKTSKQSDSDWKSKAPEAITDLNHSQMNNDQVFSQNGHMGHSFVGSCMILIAALEIWLLIIIQKCSSPNHI